MTLSDSKLLNLQVNKKKKHTLAEKVAQKFQYLYMQVEAYGLQSN